MSITKTEVEPKEELDQPDDRYFELLESITVGKDIVISKILLDPAELKGPVFFKITERFRKEYQQRYREAVSGVNSRFSDDIFLSYVIAELNPPMTVEDLQKVSFVDLDIMFLRAKAFAFLKRAIKETT
jgi:hypothetical protein